MLTEQIVYLSASALAGVARFLVLRLCVFATRPAKQQPRRTTRTAPVMLAA